MNDDNTILHHRAMHRYQRIVNVIYEVGVARVACLDEITQLLVHARLVRATHADEGYTLAGTPEGDRLLRLWWPTCLKLAEAFKVADVPLPCSQLRPWCIAQDGGWTRTCLRGQWEPQYKEKFPCTPSKWVECAKSEVGKDDVCVRQMHGIIYRCDYDIHGYAFMVHPNKENAINRCSPVWYHALSCCESYYQPDRLRLMLPKSQFDMQMDAILGEMGPSGVEDVDVFFDGTRLRRVPPLYRSYSKSPEPVRPKIGATCVRTD